MARLSPMSDDNYDRLRAFMRARRLAMGIPQYDLSRRMGRATTFGHLIESGATQANRPSLPIIYTWATALRLDAEAHLTLTAPELREPFVIDLLEHLS